MNMYDDDIHGGVSHAVQCLENLFCSATFFNVLRLINIELLNHMRCLHKGHFLHMAVVADTDGGVICKGQDPLTINIYSSTNKV